jgi:hypothetical protein
MSASLTAATLLAWLRLLALDGSLARAEPKTPALPDTARRRPHGPQRPPATPEDLRHLAVGR